MSLLRQELRLVILIHARVSAHLLVLILDGGFSLLEPISQWQSKTGGRWERLLSLSSLLFALLRAFARRERHACHLSELLEIVLRV